MRKSTQGKRLAVLICDARFKRELLMAPERLDCPFPETHVHDSECYHSRMIDYLNGQIAAYKFLYAEITGKAFN